LFFRFLTKFTPSFFGYRHTLPNARSSKKLGSRIRELRQKKGWSQEEFADRGGLNRSYIGAVERREVNLTLATLHKLSITLELSVSALSKGII
jgi:transcriptional regulator with XRE-family HTH domain